MKLQFFNLAKKLSYKSDYYHKLGAVIVYKNKPIGLGFNKPNKTDPKSNNRFRTVHAELDAILNAGDCRGASIYIYREHKDGTPSNAKPCIHCQELIRRAGIKKVYYSIDGTYKELI